ncbi:MAG: hypothetical protein RR646_03480 [Erysipelotrichaceae bacterium]
MNLVILLEGRYIRFIQGSYKNGKIKISGSSIIDLFDSGLLNSDYFDVAKLLPIVRQHINENKYEKCKVKLVLNNKQVIYRELSVPSSNTQDETRTLVKNEMIMSLNLTDDYLVNYILLEETEVDGDKMQRVLATAVLGTALSDYVDLMKKLKMKLVGLTVANDAVISLLNGISKDATTLFFDVNRSYMRLYLFDHGTYVLTRNIRTYEDESYDIEDLRRMINDNIAKMEQFQYTRNLDNPVTNVEIFGNNKYLRFLPAETYDFGGSVSVLEKRSIYNGVERYETLVNALGAYIPSEIENDFMGLLKERHAVKKGMNTNTKAIVKVLVICLLGLGVVVAALGGGVAFFKIKTKVSNSYINDSDNQAEFAKADAIVKRDKALDDMVTQTETIKAQIEAAPKLNAKLLASIYSNKISAKITSLTYDLSTVAINAEVANSTDAAVYTQNLENSGLYDTVTYTGFSGSETYNFTVNAVVKGGAPVESK